MSTNVNKILLVGRVGRNPDLEVTQSGTQVAHFALATNRRPSEDEVERTDWHRITCWDRLAHFAYDYLQAGDRIYLEGTLEYDSYERDGITIPTAEVRAREIVLLSPRRDG